MIHNIDGNTDGVFKGKRYFKCSSNHGRFVRITNVISVLPVKVSNNLLLGLGQMLEYSFAILLFIH